MATQDEIISSFEFVFTVVCGIGLLTTTQYVVNEFPQAGLMLIMVGGLLMILAKVVRRKKGIPKREG